MMVNNPCSLVSRTRIDHEEEASSSGPGVAAGVDDDEPSLSDVGVTTTGEDESSLFDSGVNEPSLSDVGVGTPGEGESSLSASGAAIQSSRVSDSISSASSSRSSSARVEGDVTPPSTVDDD
jgi:hypothetical protein